MGTRHGWVERRVSASNQEGHGEVGFPVSEASKEIPRFPRSFRILFSLRFRVGPPF
jgi:hypothetical protein